jgi:hypothetical protein
VGGYKMKLAYFLIPLLIVGLSLAYTLPGHNVKGDIEMLGNKVINLSTPVNLTDGATKGYVNSHYTGDNITNEDVWSKINKSDIGTYISGTSGYIPMFTGTNAIAGNSMIYNAGFTNYITSDADANTSDYIAYFQRNHVGTGNGYIGLDVGAGRAYFTIMPDGDLRLDSSPDELVWHMPLYIDSNGSIGINDDSPDSLLDVNGAINTESYLQMTGIGTPAAPAANALCVYSKLGQLWYRNATGDYYVGGGTSAAGGGDFYGVASSITDDIITFANTEGKTAKDSGKKLSDLVYKDGSTTLTGALPFGGYKGTGAANGTATGELVTYPQLVNKLAKIAVTVGPAGDDVSYDYETDLTADNVQISAALTLVSSLGGGVVYLAPNAQYNIEADVLVPASCTLMSIGSVSQGKHFSSPATVTHLGAAMICRDSSHKTASIQIGHYAKVLNLKFYDPDQQTTTTPDAYSPAIEAYSTYVLGSEVGWCNFVNSYIGVDMGGASGNTATSGNTYIHDNVGYPLYQGIHIGRADDTTRIENNHFIVNELYTDVNSGLYNWVYANGIAISSTDELDNAIITNNFAYYYHEMIHIVNSYNVVLNGNVADSCYDPLVLSGCMRVTINGDQYTGNVTGGYSSATDCFQVSLSGCDMTGYNGFALIDSDRCSITGGRYSGDATCLVLSDSDYCTVAGANLEGDGATNNGIYVDATCDHISINGNSLKGNVVSIAMVAGSNYYIVADNVHDTANSYGDAAGSTRVRGNDVYG